MTTVQLLEQHEAHSKEVKEIKEQMLKIEQHYEDLKGWPLYLCTTNQYGKLHSITSSNAVPAIKAIVVAELENQYKKLSERLRKLLTGGSL